MSKDAKEKRYVYFFGGKKAEGKADMKALLGGKGANLAEMVNIGLPVPAGFTITTEVCTSYYKNKKNYPAELESQVTHALKKVENKMVIIALKVGVIIHFIISIPFSNCSSEAPLFRACSRAISICLSIRPGSIIFNSI